MTFARFPTADCDVVRIGSRRLRPRRVLVGPDGRGWPGADRTTWESGQLIRRAIDMCWRGCRAVQRGCRGCGRQSRLECNSGVEHKTLRRMDLVRYLAGT